MQAKKYFIGVYECKISGVFMERIGKKSEAVPIELAYDKIESVSTKITKVYIQTAGRKLQISTFNAAEIAREISARITKTEVS